VEDLKVGKWITLSSKPTTDFVSKKLATNVEDASGSIQRTNDILVQGV
jgi:hypothetical protein